MAKVVYDVSEAIWEVMRPIYIAPPTENDWRQIEHRSVLDGTSQTALEHWTGNTS